MTDFFRLSPRAADYKARLERFMAEHIYPNEAALFETAEIASGPLASARS